MAAAWYRARAELRARWRAYAVLGLLIGLAGGVSLAAVAGARRTASSYDRFLDETQAADAFVSSNGIEPAVLRAALDLPEVTALSEGLFFVGSTGGPDDFGVIASPDGGYGRDIDRPRVLEGRLPAPGEAHEVAVNEATASKLGLRVGGSIDLGTFSPEQLEGIEAGFSGVLEGPEIPLSVVGLIRAPDDLNGVPQIGALGTPAFASRYEDEVGAFTGLFVVELADDARDLPALEAGLGAALPADAQWGIESTEDAAEPVREALGVLGTGLALFALCAGLAGAVAVGQGLSRQLAGVRDDQAALASVGMARPWRVLAMGLPAAAAALGGAFVAVSVAVAASPVFPIGVARQAEPDLGLSLDVTALALGLVAVAAVACGCALLASWKATAVGHPALGAVLRQRPSALAGLLARAGARPSALTGVRMALEPGRGRTSVPVRPALVGAVVGIAGLVAAVIFGASLDRLVGTPSRWGWSFDLAPDTVEDGAEAERMAAAPGVADVGVVNVAFVLVEGQGVQGHALETVEGSPSLAVAEGRAPAGIDEIAVGRSLLDRLGKDLGGTVELEPAGGSGDPLPHLVVGTATFPTWDDFSSDFTEGALLTSEGLDRVRQSDGASRIVIGLDEGTNPDAGYQRLVERFPENFSIYALPRPPGQVANLAQVDALPWLLGAFLAALALAAVAHALIVSGRRRQPDLALLRSIGFLRADVRAAVAWQATVLAAVGVLVGVPLGVAVGRAAWAVLARDVGVVDDPSVPLLSLALLPLAALAVANLLGLLPARAAARVLPAVALRAE